MHDVRLALRQFQNSPGFAATVILTISLGPAGTQSGYEQQLIVGSGEPAFL